MNNILLKFYRNIGISAHIDAGKTTTTERILYYSGINHKMGEVHDGNATMDWMKQEQDRGITITSAATTVFWNGMNKDLDKHRINIIDTPGHVDFTIEVERSMRVIDSVCMVYCSVAGIQSQSETVWRQSDKYNISKLIFVNKMDRIGSDFYKIYDDLKFKFNASPLPIFIPYYFNSNFLGLIDLIKMKLILWDDFDNGMSFEYKDIPLDYLDLSNKWRDNMIEKIVDGDDEMIEKYLNQLDIKENEIINLIRKKTINNEIQPMLCGSAFKNKGIQCLLDCISNFLPSPEDFEKIKGEDLKGNIVYRKPLNIEPFSAFVFKIMSDQFVGQLIFIRVYSGFINVGDYIYNSNKNKKERLSRLLLMHANKREDIKSISSGDIVAIVGIKNISTGDTLCDINNPIILEKLTFPEPVISQSIELLNKTDQDKILSILEKFMQEDPSFKYSIDSNSNQIIISGMGELHLEIIVDRIKTEYNIELIINNPKVSFRETILKSSFNIEGKYIRQSGGRGQYGHVIINVYPNEKGSGVKFINNIKGGVIPKEYIEIIEKSVIETLNLGVVYNYPVTDIIVDLINGSYHEVDSSENAFKIAASMAIKESVKKSNPILLEPIMKVDIEIPENYMGTVIGDISSKRGMLNNMIDANLNYKIIKCFIPLSEMFGYSTKLRSLTQGRGSFTMVFNNYSELPKNILNNIIINEKKV